MMNRCIPGEDEDGGGVEVDEDDEPLVFWNHFEIATEEEGEE